MFIDECNTDAICEIAKCSEPNAASLCPGFCGKSRFHYSFCVIMGLVIKDKTS